MDLTCGGVCACRQDVIAAGGDLLVVASRTSHTLSAIVRLARRTGRHAEVAPGHVRITGPDLGGFVSVVSTELTVTEREEARATYVDRSLDGSALLGAGLAAPSLGELAARHDHADVLRLVADETTFWSAFQPIVDLRTGAVVAHEALLRGDIDGEVVGPARLFGAAGAAGWTHVLDRIGRETAIRDAAPWLGGGSLFINFLPTSIYRPELCLRSTEQVGRDHGVELGQLVFEVVEGQRIVDLDHLQRIFDHYRDLGCRVALDDVGAGYSSLTLLATLKPDVVKLDMALVQGLPAPENRAIVKAVVEMSHGLGATVVAEGIETEAQLEEVVALEADLGQGFLLGRPERRAEHQLDVAHV